MCHLFANRQLERRILALFGSANEFSINKEESEEIETLGAYLRDVLANRRRRRRRSLAANKF